MNFFKHIDIEYHRGMVGFYCENIPRIPMELGVAENGFEEDGEGFGFE